MTLARIFGERGLLLFRTEATIYAEIFHIRAKATKRSTRYRRRPDKMSATPRQNVGDGGRRPLKIGDGWATAKARGGEAEAAL